MTANITNVMKAFRDWTTAATDLEEVQNSKVPFGVELPQTYDLKTFQQAEEKAREHAEKALNDYIDARVEAKLINA